MKDLSNFYFKYFTIVYYYTESLMMLLVKQKPTKNKKRIRKIKLKK